MTSLILIVMTIRKEEGHINDPFTNKPEKELPHFFDTDFIFLC